MSGPTDRGIDRRAFVKPAVAIGGASALSACLQRTSTSTVPSGSSDLSKLPERQHPWNQYVRTGDAGNPEPVAHRLSLPSNDDGDGEPTASGRQTVASALNALAPAGTTARPLAEAA